MEHLTEKGLNNPHILCWQSKVGPLPWLGPKTQDAIKDFKKQARAEDEEREEDSPSRLITSVTGSETSASSLSEQKRCMRSIWSSAKKQKRCVNRDGCLLSMTYSQMGAVFKRSPSFNDDDMFVKALADIAKSHLERVNISICIAGFFADMRSRCVNPAVCRTILNPIKPYSRFKEC
eukprot:763255-Hanusia_phi.AAC.3